MTYAAFGDELARSELVELSGSPDRRAPVKTAEDTVLRKLAWFATSRGVSSRQGTDVLEILEVRRGALDQDDLRQWAAELDVEDPPAKAMEEA